MSNEDAAILGALSSGKGELVVAMTGTQPPLNVTAKDGTASRVSAVYQAPQRDSFILALKDAPEIWEIATDPKAEAVYEGYVHSYEKGMVEALPSSEGLFALRRIEDRLGDAGRVIALVLVEILVLSRDEGLLHDIRDLVGHVDDKSFFICGPGGMYDFCLPELEGLGIPRRRIRREMYGAPENIWEYEGWPEGLDRDHLFTIQLPDGRTMNAAAGESVLMALEKHGVVVPSLCRSGECSMCRIKLTAGSVFQPPGVPVRKSDRRYGWVHSCTAYPISNLEVLV